ncbi:hypothetical protein CEXT_124191 [Caerostris extrusa]|uniref:Uncharacterized protein n=1 Tax=Caerostris extrusa TaxID=172846 RepID=A0AAV4MZY3_CAEEX|nr:hypothetical protein CEXT_124191 [Caerostris extrusa]
MASKDSSDELRTHLLRGGAAWLSLLIGNRPLPGRGTTPGALFHLRDPCGALMDERPLLSHFLFWGKKGRLTKRGGCSRFSAAEKRLGFSTSRYSVATTGLLLGA